MLVLLLLIHTVFAKELSDTQPDHPIFRNVSSCPEAGYFLSSGTGDNLRGNQCHVCFCQNNGEAVCWKHQNKRCNEKSYVHDTKIRPRRSPGFADLFFKDAARDMFQKQTPEECKPFQGSYSIGCPPADWCIGCTVCDCNANGRWECHVLSFCPGDKRKKKSSKKRRTVINEMKMKPPLRYSSPTPKPTTKRTPLTKATTKRTMPIKRQAQKYMTVQSKMKGTAPTKPTPRKNIPTLSKVTMKTKPTTRRSPTTNQPKTKRTVLTKPTINKTVQTKPAVKRTTGLKKKTMESKQAISITATKKSVKNTTVTKLNKVRQVHVKPQNVNDMKIKTNQMMRINTKQRKDKVISSPPKKPANSAKPVQKKTLTTNMKPAMRSFQNVTGKPMKNNVNKTKTVTNTMVSVKNISSKIMKSTEKIINEKQKDVSKLIKISDNLYVQPKNKVVKNNFKSEPQRNVTAIETTNKIKEKIISNKKYGVAPKRLNRNKRYTNLLMKIKPE